MQVLEVVPGGVWELAVGTRVCVYWSRQLDHLHPATVTGHHQSYLAVQLDDGDSREVPLQQVRLLPPLYPIVGGYCSPPCF